MAPTLEWEPGSVAAGAAAADDVEEVKDVPALSTSASTMLGRCQGRAHLYSLAEQMSIHLLRRLLTISKPSWQTKKAKSLQTTTGNRTRTGRRKLRTTPEMMMMLRTREG